MEARKLSELLHGTVYDENTGPSSRRHIYIDLLDPLIQHSHRVNRNGGDFSQGTLKRHYALEHSHYCCYNLCRPILSRFQGWVVLADQEHKEVKGSIRGVPMAVFVIYFSHCLRFTESRCLTRYPHPLRWAFVKYAKDVKRSQEFSIKEESLDQERLL